MNTSSISAIALAMAFGFTTAAQAEDSVNVGVLQSLSGTMAISEVTVKNAEVMAIDEINAAGGVMGHQIKAVVEDGASDPAIFAQKATKLIQNDDVATVFGGWTSASRKAMLPVFEREKALLWYPVQFEGNECSSNIMYSGAQPNQQLLPAYDWAKAEGYKSFFLLGSDYVFPRTANLIAKKHIAKDGLKLAGEEYVPLGGTDFSAVISKIRAAKPDVIFNTLNGDSNVSFFKQMAAAGMTPEKMPVMSFSIAEQEAKAMGPSLVEGSYATWNYFQSLDTPANQKFVADYQSKFGANAAITDPMVHGYLDVYAWKAAVEKAGSFDPDAVRKAAVGLDFDTPLGEAHFAANQSLVQTAYVGQLDKDGQFQILWTSDAPIEPNPYDPVAFPGKTCNPVTN
ncbi:urea ABC transporter substrate-binding protein [Pseudooceanicola sp. CBS1P-1]|uniref:Urea ABC transporter substrate-binding protein n=1 Tax=Pseudooceanicola albus TaxID=2692189 RepID=A0A6L7G0K8_9RHOB|nr:MULTISPECIES: urea ABC transporter substrate-binding protein [Pseudooceanicola]MBT9382425.1 urea ABC transporter substrate-binding protein [Pseudooceanicola endophyticus]MXN16966.1 urea ABC transporter substrate-binding protein [Pseudooceanicola albus]